MLNGIRIQYPDPMNSVDGHCSSYFSLFDSIFSLLVHLADIYVFWAADVCLAANEYIFISANGISCIALLHAFLFNLSREKPTRIPIRASGI